ncbi:hypothetical protein MTP99_001788 [Tenebrio molitor]|nr:hypothetical protein MTP99_001788 [Tenebrio molitor]
MALALILRNAPKLQAGALPQNFLKSASIIVTRDFSPLCQKQYSSFNKNNVNLNVMLTKENNLLSPQMRLMSGDHSKMWPVEKALSLSLIFLIPAAIAMPNPIFDNLAAVAAVIHFHWGLEACVVDYVRPIIVGNILPKLTLGLLYLISATTLGGLIYYNVNDIGIGKTIRKFWAIKE